MRENIKENIEEICWAVVEKESDYKVKLGF